MDRVLLIESSGQVARIGIANGSMLLAERTLDETRRHARDLAPTISELLREQDWKARDITAVFVSLGPGSYTGLRVGAISSKALAYATGCSIVAVPTFSVLARQAQTPAVNLVLVADAQQDLFYAQSFRRNDPSEKLRPSSDVSIVCAEEIIEWSPGAAFAGPGLHKIACRLTPGTAVAAETEVANLGALWMVGRELAKRGGYDDPLALEPLYLRRSSAEEQWDHRRNSKTISGRSRRSS
jgi:tRNA threonylcarbamoyladenosine biosynthesis protein TsaB